MVISITGFTAERMLEIENSTIVDGDVVGDILVLVTRDGATINAGNVRGPKGDTGPTSPPSGPAGGDLGGTYPNPTILKDAAAGTASMRTLGSGATQAAPGNHPGLVDTGWVNFTLGVGEAPFATATATKARYRRVGDDVHVQVVKATTAAWDKSASTGGDFTNTDVGAVGAVPAQIRPTGDVVGSARLSDVMVVINLSAAGTITIVGGTPRVYNSGSILVADFRYFLG